MIKRVQEALRVGIQVYAPPFVKGLLWNRDFLRGRYGRVEVRCASDDFMYAFIEEYANRGSVLDCGCGAGNTENKLDAATYREYVGVDISDVAICKAKMKTMKNGRAEKNQYVRADFFSYVPTQRFDVILFRDSIYYVARPKIQRMLHRYSAYLKEYGVFVVRMYGGADTYKPILDDIKRNFEIIEQEYLLDQTNTVVVVFRPRLA